ncbi:hypothetical protein V2J09_022349 [Rumex salicifolius]
MNLLSLPSSSLSPLHSLNPSLKSSKPIRHNHLLLPSSSRLPSFSLPRSSRSHQSLLSPAFDAFDHGFHGRIEASGPQSPETAMRVAESDAMGLLLRERIVFLGNEIDDFVADAIISQLLMLDAQDHTKDIRLFINSPGGSLSATMGIFDVLQLIRADVSTIALGIAASTASIILGGGTKGKRFAMPNTRIMVHQPLGGTSGQAIDVEIQAREILNSKNNIIRIISEFSGRSIEQIEKEIDRDRYMSPVEAMEYGIIDRVIDGDTIIPLAPVPDKVKSKLNYKDMYENPKKFLTPDGYHETC